MGMRIHAKHASHLPAVVMALQHTEGDVLELGAGLYSTFALHWLCLYLDRRLVSYEHDLQFYRMVEHCWADWHELYKINDWDDAKLEQPWGVALVDHGPAERRKVDIARLAEWAQCIVVHDTQSSQRHHYHYEEVWPLFKYVRAFSRSRPASVMASNFVDVREWDL